MSPAKRVASRYVLAGFVPDKFWREEKAKLKVLLTKPLTGSDPIWQARRGLDEDLVKFYKDFADKLIAFGVGAAEHTVQDRVGNVRHVISKIVISLDKLESEIKDSFTWPTTSPEEEIAWSIAHEIKDQFEAKVKTLYDAMRAIWQTDHRLVQGLAKRILKKATPEELAAIEEGIRDKDSFGTPASKIKYDFYRRVNLSGLAAKLIAKEKLTYDPLKWIDHLREVLIGSYTGEAGQKRHFRNFDLHGMKVVIDDSTVDDTQIGLYIRYLQRAYEALKSKGVAKVWYGTVFVRCESCGGVNYNTGGGVGGDYPIGPDVVNVYERPSDFIVKLMAHELGHRYWFKFMSQSQRGKFESLVKVRHSKPPEPLTPQFIGPERVWSAKQVLDEAVDDLSRQLRAFKTGVLKSKRVSEGIRRNSEAVLVPAARVFEDAFFNAFQKTTAVPETPEAKALFKEVMTASSKVRMAIWDAAEDLQRRLMQTPDPTEPVNPNDFWMDAVRRILPPWLEEVEQIIFDARKVGYAYIDLLVKSHNDAQTTRNDDRMRKWQEIEDADTRPVAPVSDYGKSNIDEAFAEAFAHYVTDKDMSQDQIESFRTVLKIARTIGQYLSGR